MKIKPRPASRASHPGHPQACLVIAALLASQATAWAQTAPLATDLANLEQTTAATLANIQKRGAAWTTTIDARTGVLFDVDMTLSGTSQRVVFRARQGTRSATLATLIVRDGFWYVEREGRRDKYRPYEAQLPAPAFYFFLDLADLRYYSPDQPLGQPEKTATGTITFRRMPDDATRKSIQDTIDQAKKMFAANPASKVRDETQKVLEQLQDVLVHGTRIEVDAATGVVTRNINQKMELHTTNFRLLAPTPADADLFRIDARAYADQTAPLSKNPDDVVMLNYLSTWRPGGQNADMDLVLFNVQTGQWRRLPVNAASAGKGCFSLDRTRVWVWATDPATGAMVITQVDLTTGENKPVGKTLARSGLNFMPVLSRDGKQLAMFHSEMGLDMLHGRVLIVDPDTHDEQFRGDMADRGPLSWTADNRLVFELRDPLDLSVPGNGSKVSVKHVAVMDADGKTTTLMLGHSPTVVGDGNTILFADPSGKWNTCDLDGKNSKLVGDGLEKYQFPAPAPDGKRLLMMKLGGPDGPQPCVVTLPAGDVRPIKVDPGLWAAPAWR